MHEKSREARLIAAMRNMSESDRQIVEDLAVKLEALGMRDPQQREEVPQRRHC